MPENFANRYTTTLAAAVTAGALTGTVTTATGAPAVPFRAIISAEGANTDEIVLVTGRTGTTLTWTRAVEAIAGVQAASAHVSGATITAIVTAAGLLVPNLQTLGVGLVATDEITQRMPIQVTSRLVGEDIVAEGKSSNVVGQSLATDITGDFTGIGGADPGHVWGISNFVLTGTAATDGDGITDVTALTSEVALRSPATAQNVVRGLHSNLSLWGAASGGTVAQMEGLRVGVPAFKDGALPANWAITNNYGLVVEDPGTVGTNNFAILTEGGPSRFNGRLDVLGGLVQTGAMTIGGGSFPGGPASGDVFFRTDLGELYFWNGTHWLSTTIYTITPDPRAFPMSATNYAIGTIPVNTSGARRDVFIEGWSGTVYLNGATSDASNFWMISLQTESTIDQFSTASDLGYTQTLHTRALGALTGTAGKRLLLYCEKTGSPGDLTFPLFVEYRKVAT